MNAGTLTDSVIHHECEIFIFFCFPFLCWFSTSLTEGKEMKHNCEMNMNIEQYEKWKCGRQHGAATAQTHTHTAANTICRMVLEKALDDDKMNFSITFCYYMGRRHGEHEMSGKIDVISSRWTRGVRFRSLTDFFLVPSWEENQDGTTCILFFHYTLEWRSLCWCWWCNESSFNLESIESKDNFVLGLNDYEISELPRSALASKAQEALAGQMLNATRHRRSSSVFV